MASFAEDVRPLFRDSDVQRMRFAFDLSRFEDVRDHATAIAGRLSDGSMPCDGPWPADRIALFQRWIDLFRWRWSNDLFGSEPLIGASPDTFTRRWRKLVQRRQQRQLRNHRGPAD